MHYDDLISRLRNGTRLPLIQALMNEAADAIEELQKENASLGDSLNGAAELLHKRGENSHE